MVAIWKYFPVEIKENEKLWNLNVQKCSPSYFYQENMYGFPINFKNTFYWYAKVKDYNKLNYLCIYMQSFRWRKL